MGHIIVKICLLSLVLFIGKVSVLVRIQISSAR